MPDTKWAKIKRAYAEREKSGQMARTIAWLESLDCREFCNEQQWWRSYNSWSRGGAGWNNYGIGGTYIQRAIAWYQWKHIPGSREWRPTIIMAAVDKAAASPANPVTQG